jgi:hypothetical protein
MSVQRYSPCTIGHPDGGEVGMEKDGAGDFGGDWVRFEDWKEEYDIVSRIWTMFGNPAYPFLDGRSIYDFVQDGLDAIQLLSHYREGHRQPSGQECYVNLEQGDYRCADCIEADRLTGFERQLRKMSEDRVNHLRESLNSSNNGL